MDRVLRIVAAGGALLLGAAAILRRSGEPEVFGRYSLVYFIAVVGSAPLLLGLLLLGAFGRDVVRGVRESVRSPSSAALVVLLVPPVLLLAYRYPITGDVLELVRIFALLSLAGGVAAVSVALRSRGFSRFASWFAGAAVATVSAIYVATFTITPLFGGWIERTMGLPSATTFDVVKPGEYDASLMSKPHASYTYTGSPGDVREVAIEFRNNAWGFNDRERSFENPDGAFRIMVLGDDNAHGMGVPRDSAFPALLEAQLSLDIGPTEVIRITRPGAGQAAELAMMRDYAPRLRPRIVILDWSPNDLLSNDPDLAARVIRLPEAVLFPGFLLDRLVTGWLQKRYYLVDGRARLSVLRPDYWPYLVPRPPAVDTAFARTEMLLDSIVDECRALECEVLIAMKRPGNEIRWLRRFPSLRGFRLDKDAHARRMQAWAESRGVGFVDLGPVLQAHYDSFPTGHPAQYTWPHGGFLSSMGHRLAADAIRQALVLQRLIEVPPEGQNGAQ